ncbi:MAG: hypothetical protein ACO22Y_05695, partial [Sediminibacterium sp.]
MSLFKNLLFVLLGILPISESVAQVKANNLEWTKHPQAIHSLDSLIRQSKQYGLRPNDYIFNKLNDASIHKAAIHFFTDLAYGNALPAIGYYGVQFKLNKDT